MMSVPVSSVHICIVFCLICMVRSDDFQITIVYRFVLLFKSVWIVFSKKIVFIRILYCTICLSCYKIYLYYILNTFVFNNLTLNSFTFVKCNMFDILHALQAGIWLLVLKRRTWSTEGNNMAVSIYWLYDFKDTISSIYQVFYPAKTHDLHRECNVVPFPPHTCNENLLTNQTNKSHNSIL